LNRNVPEARQFASRAETLAPRGRQRCEALVLKAQLVLDTSKRTMRDLNLVLTDALLNDPLNIQCYEIYVKGCLQMVGLLIFIY
jgi:hypothetical protein